MEHRKGCGFLAGRKVVGGVEQDGVCILDDTMHFSPTATIRGTSLHHSTFGIACFLPQDQQTCIEGGLSVPVDAVHVDRAQYCWIRGGGYQFKLGGV